MESGNDYPIWSQMRQYTGNPQVLSMGKVMKRSSTSWKYQSRLFPSYLAHVYRNVIVEPNSTLLMVQIVGMRPLTGTNWSKLSG